MENRNILIGLGTGLVAGLLVGLGIGYQLGGGQGHGPTPAAAAMPPQQDPALQNQVEAFSRIKAAQAALASDPNNVNLWVALGNDYFDTHQPQLAVDAYGKALALAPKHPKAADILTDQGVMYRELKAYDKALANFKQAGKIEPNHLPSLLNMGVVYSQDLHDKEAARKAWNKIIEVAPGSPQAEQVKMLLTQL